MLRTSLIARRPENTGNPARKPGFRWLRLTATVIAALMALLIVACGSSDDPAPTATARPATTTPPEPTVGIASKPLQATFADGQFTVNFLYRSSPTLTEAIETVDVDALLETTLSRIGSLVPDQKFKINFVDTQPFQFRDPSKTGLSDEQLETLTERGFIIQRIGGGTIAAHLNPIANTDMAVVWRDVVPSAVMESVFVVSRELLSAGVNADSLLDFMVGNGLSIMVQEEAFPGVEDRMRRLIPNFAEGVFDLSSAAEREIWAAALPELDNFSPSVMKRFFGGVTEFPAGVNAPHAGTAVGFRIVQAYLENHPGATPSSLLLTPTAEILEGANYNP